MGISIPDTEKEWCLRLSGCQKTISGEALKGKCGRGKYGIREKEGKIWYLGVVGEKVVSEAEERKVASGEGQGKIWYLGRVMVSEEKKTKNVLSGKK